MEVNPGITAEEPQLDENGNPIPPPPSNISEEVLNDINNIWAVFDTEDTLKVPIEELETILRALDIKIDDEDVFDLIKSMIDPDESGFITKEKLLFVMEDQLQE